MEVIENERLAAMEFLESDEANGLTLYLSNTIKTAIRGDEYYHAKTLTHLVELLQE